TTSEKEIVYKDGRVCLDGLSKLYENKLESVFPMNAKEDEGEIPTFTYNCNTRIAPSVKVARPRVLIPVFPGTNCEYDTAKAVDDAGGVSEIFVVRNLTKEAIAESAEEFARKVANSQIVVIPGGFSGADEPDGSGKFITAFMRNERVSFEIEKLLSQRDGLMCGICNGFQALIKLGLVPYGKITPPDEQSPTLTYNSIGRHQSKLVRTRVVSNKSPWLYNVTPGDIITVPISHGEGRLIATDEMLKTLIDNGQIATQYVDFSGLATSSIDFNPNNSMLAIEGITSPDGRVLGKMGHSERIGRGLYKNVIGDYDLKLFRSGVEYFR
ncbi:MAG: phosphoribosylformylglycinamidine synthase subunit PurQ, partial [Clostridia bacterium]|nr:phosphoribosylformylglycinamidine synthase subunit PurQ [Clostridia bacterium]